MLVAEVLRCFPRLLSMFMVGVLTPPRVVGSARPIRSEAQGANATSHPAAALIQVELFARSPKVETPNVQRRSEPTEITGRGHGRSNPQAA